MIRLGGPLAGLGRSVSILLLGLLLAEGLVSLLAPQHLMVIEPGLYEVDPPGRYRLAPGYRGSITNRVEFDHAVAVDERGLRVTGVEGSRRLLAIGDSYTFGIGVEDGETFVAELGRRLDATALNGGLPGTGVPDLVSWYERHGRSLGPDILLLAIFLGNDLADARPDREPIRIVDGLVAPAAIRSGWRGWFYRRFDLVRLLKSAVASPALEPVRDTLGIGEPWQVANLRYELSIYATEPSRELEAAAEATSEALRRLADMARYDDVRLLAALLPTRIQLLPQTWRLALEQVGLDPEIHDPEQPRRIFVELLERHDIEWLDLTPPFAAAVREGAELYHPRDRHWTAAGHQLAAELIARRLTETPPTGDAIR